MESRELDLAVAAGLFVGEGCIYAGKAREWVRRVSIGSREKVVVVFFQKVVGTGIIYRRKDGMWMFDANDTKGVHVIKLLLPYLIGSKRRQAELFLEYNRTFGRPGRAGHGPDYDRRRALADEIAKAKRLFNANGVNSVEALPDMAGHAEPSSEKGNDVSETAYRLEGEDPTNTPSTSAPAERYDIVGAA